MREESPDLDWTSFAPRVADETKDEPPAQSEEEDGPAGSSLREDLPDPGPKSYSK